MALTIQLSPEKEKALHEEANRRGVSMEVYAKVLVEEHLPANGAAAGEEESDPEALSRAVLAMTSRTPEQINAAQEKAEALIKPGRPLPPGKTIFDVVAGKWPGDETDDEIARVLERLS